MNHRVAHFPSTQDLQRHQAMIRCVQQWTTRTRATQQRLVQAIEDFWQRRGDAQYKCDHTLLSRILNPVTPHVPTPRRPKSMRILQAAMVVCANTEDPNLIAPATDEDNAWTGDDEQAFKVHRARLRHLRDNCRESLFQALHRLGEFVAVAANFDHREPTNEESETLRQRACENVLLALAAMVDAEPGIVRLSDRLAAEGVAADMAERIEQQQVERVDRLLEAVEPPSVNMLAYGGAALFHSGQQERGMRLLLQAAEQCHDVARRHDPHWQTLIELLERLFDAGHAQVKRWSRQAAQIALDFMHQGSRAADHLKLLRQSWDAVHAPALAEHWDDVAPDLTRHLRGEEHMLRDVSLPMAQLRPRVRKQARPLTLPAWLVAMVLTAAPALAAMPATSDRDQPRIDSGAAAVEWSIRGREARNPPPPPPPPRPTRHYTPVGYVLTH